MTHRQKLVEKQRREEHRGPRMGNMATALSAAQYEPAWLIDVKRDP